MIGGLDDKLKTLERTYQQEGNLLCDQIRNSVQEVLADRISQLANIKTEAKVKFTYLSIIIYLVFEITCIINCY